MAPRQFIRSHTSAHYVLTAAALVGSLVIAASAGSRGEPRSTPDVLRVSKLQIVRNGAVVAEISASPDGDGQVILYDRAGATTATLPFKPHFRLIGGASGSTADTARPVNTPRQATLRL